MNDRVVIVTGAGRGIGRAVCRRFAAAGARVVAAARSEDQLAETQDLIEAEGGQCSTMAVDVASSDRLRHLIETIDRRHGRIDVLVNNAGVIACGPVADLSAVEFENMLRVNVAAVFYASKFVWPVMKRQGGGTIVNVSSMAARDPFPTLGTYGACKRWVNGLTRGLADEGKEAGIRVFAVGPGAVWTDMLRDNFPDVPKDQALDPADVAETIFSLCQPAMAHASGQTFYIQK
ncbi:MAG: SDR family oxidoreductase [Planctomycetes bacterium]|nr:SDR family oxidoreductase [Planctomycetota bacterium]